MKNLSEFDIIKGSNEELAKNLEEIYLLISKLDYINGFDIGLRTALLGAPVFKTKQYKGMTLIPYIRGIEDGELLFSFDHMLQVKRWKRSFTVILGKKCFDVVEGRIIIAKHMKMNIYLEDLDILKIEKLGIFNVLLL